MALTSLITFDLAAASKDVSLTSNTVFSFGFSYILRRKFRAILHLNVATYLGSLFCRCYSRGSGGCSGGHSNLLNVQPCLKVTEIQDCQLYVIPVRQHGLTLSSDTRSAACKSVKPEMSSTILVSLGSEDVAGAGGGGVDDVEGSAEAVARHLDELANVLGLHMFGSSMGNSKTPGQTTWTTDLKRRIRVMDRKAEVARVWYSLNC